MSTLNPWQREYLEQLAEEATILARREGLRPTLATEALKTYRHSHRLNIPNLGNYVPDGWKRIDYLIEPVAVNITGRSRPGEFSSITPSEFVKLAEQHTKGEASFIVGYGVIEQGQTHVIIATFRKEV